MIGLIRAYDLDRWGTNCVPPECPRLVRRLVHATGRQLRSVDFPADEAIRTPQPARIGYAESHGCVRLTNWDALAVAALVDKGTTVVFEP